jgi:hypothetical protein
VFSTAYNPNDESVDVTLALELDGDGDFNDFVEVLPVDPGESSKGYAFQEDTTLGVRVLFEEEVIFQDILVVDCETPADVPVPALFNVEPTAPTCDTAGSFDTAVFPIDREGYVLTVDRPYDGPGVYTITATAKEGFVIEGSISREVTVLGPTGYQSEDPTAPCFLAEPIEVGLTPPTYEDPCGTDNDWAYLPESTDGVTYSWASMDEDNLDVLAVASEGYLITSGLEGWTANEDGSYTYVSTFEFTDEACPTPEPTPEPEPEPTPPPTLATTGGTFNIVPWAGGALAFILAGISMMAGRKVFARR